MTDRTQVTIRPFRANDQAAAKELILQGLEEHYGWRDLSLNPDLGDIARAYSASTFLVAAEDSALIGTGALVPRGEGVGEVVRMSVVPDRRRAGIGRCLLAELCEQARSRGVSRLIVETTASWLEVIAFYLSFGFEFTHEYEGEAYFALNLASFAKR
jgi:putative acetyltransferase